MGSWWSPALRAPVSATREVCRRLESLSLAAAAAAATAGAAAVTARAAAAAAGAAAVGAAVGEDAKLSRDQPRAEVGEVGEQEKEEDGEDVTNGGWGIDDEAMSQRRRWLSHTWRDWAPLLAVQGGLGGV